ncbi:PEP-CTERM sorting domain-containing protein [Crocosphaera sp. Alani8]|uniref:PEP-CTERM sorting domain-containing protein n=1 Tax=Crocosphaera sp. Alani8 TaxID=3038952 RepID=UPI00313EBA61
MKYSQCKYCSLLKSQGFSYVASFVAVASIVASADVVNAATFSFSFGNENGLVDGTVEGTIELPDGDGTFSATSIIVTSAPTELGYTYPLDFFNSTGIFENSFTVENGMIDKENTQFEVEFAANVVFGLRTSFSGGASFLTDSGNPNSSTFNTGVFDSDSSTLIFSVPSVESTPEPTSIITLLGVSVLGLAKKLKEKN